MTAITRSPHPVPAPAPHPAPVHPAATSGPVPLPGPATPTPSALQQRDAAHHGDHQQTHFKPSQAALGQPPAAVRPTDLKAQYALATLSMDLARTLMTATDAGDLQKTMTRVDATLQQTLGKTFATGLYSGLLQKFGHLAVATSAAIHDPAQMRAMAAVLGVVLAIELYPPAGTFMNGALMLAGGLETMNQLNTMITSLQKGDSFGAGQAAGGALLDAAMTLVAGKGFKEQRGHWRQSYQASKTTAAARSLVPLPAGARSADLKAADMAAALRSPQMASNLRATVKGLQNAKQALKAQFRHTLQSTDRTVHTSEIAVNTTSPGHDSHHADATTDRRPAAHSH